MDFSKYIQMQMEAANTYRSHWRPRDASEVTLRNQSMVQQNNASTHRGPVDECCAYDPHPNSTAPPQRGFSTDYSMDSVTMRPAGCANCNDAAWGASGGVTLQNCSTIATILQKPLNPMKRAEPFWGTDRPIDQVCEPCQTGGVIPTARTAWFSYVETKSAPAYSGWRNHVPITNTGGGYIQTPLLASK